MNTNVESSRRSGCPCCGVGPIVDALRTEVIELSYDGDSTTVDITDVPIERCVACGEEFSGPLAAEIKHRAICRVLGLLDPDEIRQLRERLGLTQAELSRLTGIGEATISRWERGRLLQNRANDRYLRLLAAHPKNYEFLKRLGSPNETKPGATAPTKAMDPSKVAFGRPTLRRIGTMSKQEENTP